MAKPTFNDYIGLEFVTESDGTRGFQLRLNENCMNYMGNAHGGLIFSFCDAAAGLKVKDTCGVTCVTLSSSIQYLHAATGGILKAKTHIIKRGHTIIVADADIYDDQQRHIAHSTFEFYVTGE